MPELDDWIDSHKRVREKFSSADSLMENISFEIASKAYPKAKLVDSPNIHYFQFKLCHSLPKINERGRSFFPKVLANSFASLNDQLIDLDHQLEANGHGLSDIIIGHVKATSFHCKEAELSSKEVASLTTPIPVMGLGALFKRAAGVKEIIENHSNKNQKCFVSMECGHFWSDAYFILPEDNYELIPVKDAEIAMRNCVKSDSVLPYKGRRLAVCLGGLEGKVDFWGLACTPTPADKDADVSFIGISNEEISSKTFYMPMYEVSKKELEVASTTVDKKQQELSSISIIGETEEADGHKHFILSNLTILPQDGHLHYLPSFSLSRGSNPSLTGATDSYYASVPERNGESGVYSGKAHVHLLNVPLKGRYKHESIDSQDSEYTDSIKDFTSEESNMPETIKELVTAANALVEKLGKATDDNERNKLLAELANNHKEVATLMNKTATQEERDAAIQAQIKEGKLLTKEMADQLVNEKIEEEKKKHDAELKEKEVRQSRLDKLRALNIDPETEFEGITDSEGKPMTYRKKLETLPIDEAGERMFNMDAAVWAELVKDETSAESVTTETKTPATPATPATPLAEAASAPKKKKIGAIAGAGPTKETEIASTEEEEDEIPKHLLGRRSFKTSKV